MTAALTSAGRMMTGGESRSYDLPWVGRRSLLDSQGQSARRVLEESNRSPSSVGQ